MEKTMGRNTVSTCERIDETPDFSWLGEYTDKRRYPETKDQKLVDRLSGAVLDHTGFWRDERGRIVEELSHEPHGREYQYTWHNNGHERIAYALQDHRRLEDYNRGGWCFLGLVATVSFDGAEIGRGSLWGIESDSKPDFIATTEREIAHEALEQAREWLTRNVK